MCQNFRLKIKIPFEHRILCEKNDLMSTISKRVIIIIPKLRKKYAKRNYMIFLNKLNYKKS